MGKINVIISDDVDTKFREEVFRRRGMKKGNLTEAIEEAMTLWMNSDVMGKMKTKALDWKTTGNDLKNVVDALAAQGKIAIPVLTDLMTKKGLKSEELEHITKTIQTLSQPKTQ